MLHSQVRTLRDFARIWFYWQRYALIAAALVLGVGIYRALAVAPAYTSTAKILVLPRTSEGTLITSGTEEKRVEQVTREDVNTEIELMTSDDVLRATIGAFADSMSRAQVCKPPALAAAVAGSSSVSGRTSSREASRQAIGELRRSLVIRAKPASNIIELQFTAQNPELAAGMLNRFVDQYIAHHNRVFNIEQGIDFFTEQADTILQKLEHVETALREYQTRHELIDIDKQNSVNLSIINGYEREAQELGMNEERAKTRISLLRQALVAGDQGATLTESMRSVPLLVELESAIVPLLMKRSAIMARYTEASAEYRAIQERVHAALAERDKQIRKAIRAEYVALARFRTQRDTLYRQIAALRDSALLVNLTWESAAFLRRDADLLRQNYLLYASKKEDARIFTERLRRNITNVSIADRADVPTSSSASARRLRVLSLTFLLALCVTLLLPYLIEMADLRVKTASDITTSLSMPVLGTFGAFDEQA